MHTAASILWVLLWLPLMYRGGWYLLAAVCVVFVDVALSLNVLELLPLLWAVVDTVLYLRDKISKSVQL